ncbi:MAG: ATP-binding protein [Bacteroidales bacterium]|nr:ATP-binding protein [Bacteroidales bacterium]
MFIDEMPWMDTQKSDFLTGLDFFWNAYASAEKNIVLIVCGSASSWIVKKLLKNRGGLHNRVTQQIVLQPFTLKETEEYFMAKGIALSRYQMAESYMIFGGVPYYLSLFQKKYGLSQNVDNLCFNQNGKLRDEFEELYASLFNNYENHIAIVKALSTKTKGLMRSEIVDLTKLPNGGNFTKTLQELELCGFIRKYNAFEKKQKEAIYQLIDNFTLFYYNFMAENRSGDEHFWTNLLENPTHRAWSGYAFEQVCLSHITQIKRKLGILGVHTKTSSWRCKTEEGGAQIDLLIERNDNVINLCEIKYSKAEFVIDKKYNAELRGKKELFHRESKTRKALHQTLITTFGIKHNEYWGEVQSEVILDDLFN